MSITLFVTMLLCFAFSISIAVSIGGSAKDGSVLVQHPDTAVVAFTGSVGGGPISSARV